MRQDIFRSAALLFCLAAVGRATVVYVPITVNSSTISGTNGSLDMQFNPGPLVTQGASIMVTNFVSNGTLVGPAAPFGDVSGTLPGTLTFDNATAFNDYFEDFRFGTNLSFTVALSGPAVSSPNGTATSGSEFAFSMFSDTAGTIPTLTTDITDGFAVTLNVGLIGQVTPADLSSQTTVGAITTVTPEPSSLGFALIGLTGGGWMAVRRLRLNRRVRS